ncbi:hypothetical protein OGZ51_11685 [Lactococcus lactis]|uniref:Gram-positive cocci surface proteins LPxTG domain-containing protein n=1 Tax=Lactococcus lactis TaxID=1358 RepID=A0A9X4NIR3_9LACT|nr:hypothetical protein [Lactococcus lactis]MDG4984805.1 hypothetical protein [Lactococcus lactis]
MNRKKKPKMKSLAVTSVALALGGGFVVAENPPTVFAALQAAMPAKARTATENQTGYQAAVKAAKAVNDFVTGTMTTDKKLVDDASKALDNYVTTAGNTIDQVQVTRLNDKLSQALDTYKSDLKQWQNLAVIFNNSLDGYDYKGTQADKIDIDSNVQRVNASITKVEEAEKKTNEVAKANIGNAQNWTKAQEAANAVTAANAKLTTNKTKINTLFNQLQAAVNATSGVKDWDAYLKTENDLEGQIDAEQADYQRDIKAYESAAKNYNAVLNSYDYQGTQAKPIDIDTLVSELNKSYAGIDPKQETDQSAAQSNYDMGVKDEDEQKDIDAAYQAAHDAYSSYETALDTQNTDQNTLADVVAAFPWQSATTQDAASDYDAWQMKYTAAVQKVQEDIQSVSDKGKTYQTALDSYNALSSNPLFPDGNPTVITDSASNSAQDYLNALQNPTNLSDLTAGTGTIPDAVKKYQALEGQGALWEDIQSELTAYTKVTDQIGSIKSQIQEIVNWYKNFPYEEAITHIDGSSLTSADVQTILAELSSLTTRNDGPSLQSLYDQANALASQLTAVYNDFSSAIDTYNAGPAVTGGYIAPLSQEALKTNYNGNQGIITGVNSKVPRVIQSIQDGISSLKGEGDTFATPNTYTGDPSSVTEYTAWVQAQMNILAQANQLGTVDVNNPSDWNRLYTYGFITLAGIGESVVFPTVTPVTFVPPTWTSDYVVPTRPTNMIANIPVEPNTPTPPTYIPGVTDEVVSAQDAGQLATPVYQAGVFDQVVLPLGAGVPAQPNIPVQPNTPVPPSIPVQPSTPVRPDIPVQPHNTGKNLPTTGEKSGRFLTVIGGLAIIGVLGMTYEVLKRRKTE